MTFQSERIADMWDEAIPLMIANHAETGAVNASDFQPKRDDYQRMQDLGLAQLFTARKDGALIGYALFLVVPHPHYHQLVWATQDVMYLDPSHRGISGVRFIQFADQALKAAGCHLISRAVSAKHDYSRTLARMGYQAVETNYMRRL